MSGLLAAVAQYVASAAIRTSISFNFRISQITLLLFYHDAHNLRRVGRNRIVHQSKLSCTSFTSV